MTVMTAHSHLPLARTRVPADEPAPLVLPEHGPDRGATFREICRGISEALPTPMVTTIPKNPTGRVRLLVDGESAVDAWAGWLGATDRTGAVLPDGSSTYEVSARGWLGWERVIVSARIPGGER